MNSLHLGFKANAPGVPAIWQAADVLQPLQAWIRLSCVFLSLRLAGEKSQHSKGKLYTLEQNLNYLCFKWPCQLWAVKVPVPSCLLLLEEMDMYPADYRCRLARSKLASAPKAVTKPLPKSIAVLIVTFGMWICATDFLPSYVQILLQFFQLCTLIQLDSQAGQEQAIPILEWQTSLQEGNGSGNLIHWMALLLPGSDIPPRSWLPLVVKYPIAVVIGTNGINHILQPNLDMNISPPGSSWKFFSLWKDFLCLKHHTFNLVPLNTGCV